MTKKLLGREIVGNRHTLTKEVRIAEWDGEIRIRQLSHTDVRYVQSLATDAVDTKAQRVRDLKKISRFGFETIRLGWIDGDNEPVLSDSKEDYDWLAGEPNTAFDAVFKAISEFSGMNAEAAKDAEKNSEPILNGASGSA